MSFNKAIKAAKTIDDVRRSAFWHLGRRDHSEKELRQKIGRKTDNQEWIDKVINECFAYDYLNEKRFIDNFIRSAQNRGFGVTRIKRDLLRRGVDSQNLFTNDNFDYLCAAATLLTVKYNKRLANPNIKQKASAFLQGKGHNFDTILQAIDLHNEAYPEDDCDYAGEAIALLCRKFKTAINAQGLHNKALRFLISRGYTFSDTADAIKRFNEQINKDD